MKKSYTVEDLIKSNSIAHFFYKLTKTREPQKKSPFHKLFVYKLKIKTVNLYLSYLTFENLAVSVATRYYPFSNMFKGHLNHHQFRIERKIIEDFDDLASSDGMWINIKGFDSDKVYAYYVGFFQFGVNLEEEIKKLQKTIQKVNPNFFVREYEDGWFKILMPWSKYLTLREKYERKYD